MRSPAPTSSSAAAPLPTWAMSAPGACSPSGPRVAWFRYEDGQSPMTAAAEPPLLCGCARISFCSVYFDSYRRRSASSLSQARFFASALFRERNTERKHTSHISVSPPIENRREGGNEGGEERGRKRRRPVFV